MIPAWLRGSVLLATTLACGVAIGVAVERERHPVSRERSMEPAALLHALDRDLQLDSAQHARIADVLARHQHAIDVAWRAVRPGVKAAIDSSQMEIVNVLTPEQQVKYMALVRVAHPGMSDSGMRGAKPASRP